ncbi:hypothetical protein F66182_4217 [Fusarium sp. NRRL 66182]|nr:hypothetical protein F66182_4217 [Fusarium sp. NRRL 66182]
MSSNHDHIQEWLAQIPHVQITSAEVERPAKKRKRDDSRHQLPSPEPSAANSDHSSKMSLETPRKRQLVDQAVDNHETPRPKKAPSIAGSGSILRDAPSLSSQSDTSQRSGRSSPIKVFPIHGMDNHLLTAKSLDANQQGLPSELKHLLRDMKDIREVYGIIPESFKVEIENLPQPDQDLQYLRSYAYTSSSDFDLDPSDPKAAARLLTTFKQVVLSARECHERQNDETGWNHLVHTSLLHTVFRGSRWPENAIVDYLPSHDSDSRANVAVMQLYNTLGLVNHTAFHPLAYNPISLSIETKRYGGDLRRAHVQMAAWHASQWTFLESQAQDAVSKLPFLPGIIVQGHEWKFIASTRNNKETTLWSSSQFGDTLSVVGVFQIVAGLYRLRRWSVDVYWPWYREYVLMLADRPAEQ